jgi:hypothetical protein
MFLFTAFFLQAELNHIIILWCTFCWGFRFRWISNYFRAICTQLGQRLLPANDDAKYSVQRLFEFEMVADGYCNNCYHNYCVILSLFWLHVYLTIVVAAIYNIESTLISLLGVLIRKRLLIWVLERCFWDKKAFNIKPCWFPFRN